MLRPSTQLTPANKASALLRLLLVQDQTKAFAYVTQAYDAGKITKIRRRQWRISGPNITTSFQAFVLRRLLRAKNESNVKAFLDKAVANGKITVDQENKVLAIWEIIHSPAPTSTTPTV